MTARVNRPYKRPGPKPGSGTAGPKRITREQRAKRDATIMRLFIAGVSENEIAAHHSVGLHQSVVHRIIKKEIQDAAEHRELLSDQALAIYVDRLEALLRAAWPKALSGDAKGIEVARRLMEMYGRLYGLEDEARGNLLAPMGVESELEGVVEPGDELAAYRQRHRPAQGQQL
jgi:hypothetical protein